MFHKFVIDYKQNPFQDLIEFIKLENINRGRQGANLVDCKDGLVPIVRTTTSYANHAQRFLSIHYELIENIKKISGINELNLNNALIEIYDPSYRNMRFHSDQALDLEDNSYICIFSCYDISTNVRKLKIREKESMKCSEIVLDHNSVVIFSTETNKKYSHKIVLDNVESKGKWLGITFRLSKTFIKFTNNISKGVKGALSAPYLNNEVLKMADENERREFLRYKGLENSVIDYVYPAIHYTLSPGDLLPIADI